MIDSQFNYAPLLRTFRRKTRNSKIEKIHHNTLKVIYESNDTYDNLLLQRNTVSLHQRHLRFLMTEINKSTSQLNSEFICSYFTNKDVHYSVRKDPTLALPKTCSFTMVQMLLIFGIMWNNGLIWVIWNNVLAIVKSSNLSFEFKNKIKNIGNISMKGSFFSISIIVQYSKLKSRSREAPKF